MSLRVFLSYSHDDRAIFETVRASIRNADVQTTSDVELKPGQGFTEQIQAAISHAHAFVPILTPRSHARGWVHQEIGFAVAMRVPCVPICVGNLPDGMIAMSQAVVVNEDLSGVEERVAAIDFSALVERAGRLWVPPGEMAREPEERSRVVQEQADAAFEAIGPGRVRIAGGLSSFSLPDEEPDHVKWLAAYGDRPRSEYSYRLSRLEIQALKKHVRHAGLSMIVNGALDLDQQRGIGVTRTRLCLLVEFLRSAMITDERCTIVVLPQYPPDLFLAVGDWFMAESRAPRAVRGVLNTTFVTHAPTVGRCIVEFDERLVSLLERQGVPKDCSREHAIAQIEARIRELPAHEAWSCHV